MLPLDEFREAYQAYRHRLWIVLSSLVLVPLLMMGTSYAWHEKAVHLLEQRLSTETAKFVARVAPVGVCAVTLSAIGFWAFVGKRDPRLRCNVCRRWLIVIGPIIIATRKCGRCGETILLAPKDEHDCDFSEEVAEPCLSTQKEYRRAILRSMCWVVAALALMFSGPVLCIALGRMMTAVVLPLIQSQVPNVPAADVKMGVALTLACSGMLLSAICLTLSQSSQQLLCPCCRRPRMLDTLALTSEHCQHCGRYVPFADSPQPRPKQAPQSTIAACTMKLPSVGEYLQARHHFLWRQLGYRISLTGALLFVGYLIVFLGVQIRGSSAIEAWWALTTILAPATIWLIGSFLCWQRSPLLRCYFCRKGLVSGWPIVVATRHCPHCGRRTLAQQV
jgi:hypothetical protein